MGVSNDVIHIWSRDNGAGERIKLDESDVTITEMIQDELQRLDTQQTRVLRSTQRLRRDHGDGSDLPEPAHVKERV